MPITFYAHVVDAILDGNQILHPLSSQNLLETILSTYVDISLSLSVSQSTKLQHILPWYTTWPLLRLPQIGSNLATLLHPMWQF